MKFLSIIFILWGLGSVAVLGAEGGDRDGSTGTSGGGDYKVDPAQYLPKHISVRQESVFTIDQHYVDQSNPPVLQWKPCWGIPFFPKCPFFASGTISTFEFDRDRMHASDLGMTASFQFVRPDTKEDVPVPNNLIGLEHDGFLSFDARKLFPEKYYRPMRRKFVAQIDGVVVASLSKSMEQMFDKIFATIDVSHPETFVPVFELRSVLEKLGLSQLEFEERIGLLFHSLVKVEGDHWYALAKSVATEQKCEPSAYSHFVQAYRQWDTGSSQYFDRLAQKTGLRFSSEVTGPAISKRSKVRQLVLDALSECVLFLPAASQPKPGGQLREATDGTIDPVFEEGDTH